MAEPLGPVGAVAVKVFGPCSRRAKSTSHCWRGRKVTPHDRPSSRGDRRLHADQDRLPCSWKLHHAALRRCSHVDQVTSPAVGLTISPRIATGFLLTRRRPAGPSTRLPKAISRRAPNGPPPPVRLPKRVMTRSCAIGPQAWPNYKRIIKRRFRWMLNRPCTNLD